MNMSDPKHTVTAGAIVMNDQQEILLITGPRRGWEPPGGRVEVGESIRDAAIRETKEESGIDIEITAFCGIFQDVTDSVCSTLFLGKPIGGVPTTSAESLEVGFFPLSEALELVTWRSFRQRIEYCLNPELQPFCIEF